MKVDGHMFSRLCILCISLAGLGWRTTFCIPLVVITISVMNQFLATKPISTQHPSQPNIQHRLKDNRTLNWPLTETNLVPTVYSVPLYQYQQSLSLFI